MAHLVSLDNMNGVKSAYTFNAAGDSNKSLRRSDVISRSDEFT